MDDKYYTPHELAEILNVKVSTIYNWSHIGFIPTVRIGKLIRFRGKAVEEWLARKEDRGRLNRKIRMQLVKKDQAC